MLAYLYQRINELLPGLQLMRISNDKNLKRISTFIFLVLSTVSFAQPNTIKELMQDATSGVDTVRMNGLASLAYTYLRRDLDSANLFLEQLYSEVYNNNQKYLAIWNSIEGLRMSYLGKYDSAIIRYRASMRINTEIDRRYGIMNDLNLMANLFDELGELDSAIVYYEKSKKLAEELSDSSGLVVALHNIGVHYFEGGNYKKSLSYYYDVLAYEERIGTNEDVSLTNLNIGNLLSIIGSGDQGEKYIVAGITLAEEDENHYLAGYGYKLLGDYYLKAKDYVLAEESLNKALKHSLKVGDPTDLWEVNESLMSLYLTQEKWEQAERISIRNLDLLTELKATGSKYNFYALTTYLRLSNLYLETERNDLANKYLLRAEEIDLSIELDLIQSHNLLSIYKDTYEKFGNYKKAFEYLNKSKSLNDSILNQSNQQKIIELEKEFETEKKEQQIAMQELELEKKSHQLQSQIIIASLILLLVIGGAFVYYKQYKLKRDKISIELEQRFLRSQLNPHFIFNSLSAIHHYLMTQSKEDTGEYLTIFSSLMRQILENSRKEFILLEEEIDTLKKDLALQGLRFEKGFVYHIEVDDDLDEENLCVPPMFAQPFIENSLEHGLFQKDGVNEITVTFSRKDSSTIRLEVIDSGVGIEGKEVKSQDHRSLAKVITHERLEKMKFTYKSDLKLTSENIMSSSGNIQGYKVSLELPSRTIAFQ